MVNITINDGRGEGVGWYSLFRENNEVEPGNVASQNWDMEGFFLDGNTLIMQGGYNFTTSLGYDGFKSGDIFIDVNGNGYDYVARISNVGATYDVYSMGNTFSVFYAQNATSNPWRYKNGGESIFEDRTISYTSFLDDEGTHYVANLNIEWLTDGLKFGDKVLFHYTMECGNDNLLGEYYHVIPESYCGGYLVGAAIIALALYKKLSSATPE